MCYIKNHICQCRQILHGQTASAGKRRDCHAVPKGKRSCMSNIHSSGHDRVLHVPEGTEYVGNRYYSGRNDFEEVVFPDSVADIGVGAFADCTSLVSISLPAGLTRIRKELFSGCAALKRISVPDSVNTIGEWAFRCCSALEEIELPLSVTDIAAEAFLSCPRIVITAVPGSYAEKFAMKHDIPFRSTHMA